MKRIFSFLILFMLSFSLNTAVAYEIKGSAQTKRIPRGTRIELKMITPITTENISAGDMFTSSIVSDVKAEGEVVLPKGTVLRGNIGEVKDAKKLSKAAILYLNFDHVVIPSGRQLPIKAVICSEFKMTNDGGITQGGNYGYAVSKNLDKSVDMVKKSVAWGVKSGEELFTGGRFLITPIAAIGGSIGGGAYFIGKDIIDLFRKGEEVVINQGTQYAILLLE